MNVTNSVSLPGAPDEVMHLLLDLERVAGCMPGATLTGHDGDTWFGDVKVKVGPLAMTYAGSLRVLDVDQAGHVVVMKASGRERNGLGNVDAHVRASLAEEPGGSLLRVETELQIRGRAAQFGRGAIGEVSQKIMQLFAENVAGLLRPPAHEPAPDSDEAPGLDLGSLLLPGWLRRAAPVLGALLVAGIVVAVVARRQPGADGRPAGA